MSLSGSVDIVYLKELEIGTLIHYPIPPHLSEAYASLGYKKGDFPIAEQYANEVLSLPMYNGMTFDEQTEVIIAINKWDLIQKDTYTMAEYKKQVYNKLAYLKYAPIIFMSVVTGQRINNIFELINTVDKNNNLRVPTGLLNDVISEAIAITQPPSDKGRRLKVFYITQVS